MYVGKWLPRPACGPSPPSAAHCAKPSDGESSSVEPTLPMLCQLRGACGSGGWYPAEYAVVKADTWGGRDHRAKE